MLNSSSVTDLRNDFPLLKEKYNGKEVIYFDNAATSQKPQQVIDAVSNFYSTSNANVHRGIHFLSDRADEAYLKARKVVQSFINAESLQEIVFVRNASEAVNLVARSYGRMNLKQGDEVIVSRMEHHSNIVPWQMLKEEQGIVVHFVDLDDEGRFVMSDFEKLLSEKTKLVAVVHVSNVLGMVNPVKEIVKKAHAVGAKVLVDGCQSAPHMHVDVQALDCDFFAFSAHKMCGPMGIGVLYGKKELLQVMPPFLGGGGMIAEVTDAGFSLGPLPERFEAGTPNVAGAVGMAEAALYLDKIGIREIHAYEQKLGGQLYDELAQFDFVKILGSSNKKERMGIVSFALEGVHPHDVSEFLNNEAICVRAGNHCTQPLMQFFDLNSSVRASVYFYNTSEEVVRFAEAIEKCYHYFSR